MLGNYWWMRAPRYDRYELQNVLGYTLNPACSTREGPRLLKLSQRDKTKQKAQKMILGHFERIQGVSIFYVVDFYDVGKMCRKKGY